MGSRSGAGANLFRLPMQALIVLAITFALLWVLFILPQQRRVRAHQQLVSRLDEGDEVVLTAGIYGRITELGPEEMKLEVAPGVEMLVARQAVLRRIETGELTLLESDETGEIETGASSDGTDAAPGSAAGQLPAPGPEATDTAEPE